MMPGAREGFVLREFAGAVEPVAAHLAKLGRQEGQPGLRGAAPPPPHSRPPAHSSALSTMYIRDWRYSTVCLHHRASNAKCSCECVEWLRSVEDRSAPGKEFASGRVPLFATSQKGDGLPGMDYPEPGPAPRER